MYMRHSHMHHANVAASTAVGKRVANALVQLLDRPRVVPEVEEVGEARLGDPVDVHRLKDKEHEHEYDVEHIHAS